ncbi:hypothetical protein [Cohnella fermenti]|uniref:Uncharacterized protein n=1 Tax=Cohnella fermenti TaxID=2565925 RepID=A0A4S4BJC9_9BACL|nr:hypothetical protein [Cohnella fermenti]THF74753.1 hypothetical protein E6C55_24405 [Cohnella fermenti]
MRKRVVIGGILLLFLSGATLLASSVKEAPPPAGPTAGDGASERIVVKEGMASGVRYIQYRIGGNLYVEDTASAKIVELRSASGEERSILTRAAAGAVTDYSYLPGTELVDPVSLQLGITPSIPYTYDASLVGSSRYLDTLLADGWEMRGTYSSSDYIDCYLRKGDIVSRVIVLRSSLKVFYGVNGPLPDPLKYASE